MNARYAEYTHEQYCRDYIEFLDKHKLLDQLQALRVTVNDEKTFAQSNTGYCVLLINFRNQIVTGRQYTLEQEDEASAMFTQTGRSCARHIRVTSWTRRSFCRRWMRSTRRVRCTGRDIDIVCIQ